MSVPVLKAENLGITFGGLKAVEGFHVEIEQKELIGLIGPNGAGKTTVFNLLTGVYQPTEGAVYLNGTALIGKKPHQMVAAGIARTFQNIRLFKKMSVLERADPVAENLPYGQQRKLEIARALATNPKVLLLDEPAAGMNPTETAELMQAISLIRERFGIAILLIEHDMSLVMNVCERIVVIDYGQIIAHGTPKEIANNPRVIGAYLGE